MTERTLFLELLDIDDPEQRSSHLRDACAGQPELRLRVEDLLRVHQGSHEFMQRPATTLLGGETLAGSEDAGQLVGPYRLVELIGEGGFGRVFLAEQQHPVRRLVALKVLKPGMDTRQVVARFEAERQALALMDHANIARVFDCGETDNGRPYFAMELVKGVPITEFCEQNRLPVPLRLELFVSVCRAVEHAHQKGIIHRDLKPSNLLVAADHDSGMMVEGAIPRVKVIDFGIAKATGQQLTEKTLQTNLAQLVGTPMYMSPEQIRMSGLDIDTRSDIYALGVLLYELLTGSTPFDRKRLRGGYEAMRRLICEEDPPRPSSRLATCGAKRARRSAAPPCTLRGSRLAELDWIVMKALEKDRNRRYDTVSALAADVQRYLREEPVHACPPSAWYRFRKLARRHKGVVLAGLVSAFAILLTVAGLVCSNILIRQEQARTREEKDRADSAQKLAEARARQIQQDLEHLKTANVLLERGRWYAQGMRLDDANAALSKAAELRPDHAAVWLERSELYTRLGLWEPAAADFARELKLREPDSTLRWLQHALLRVHLGDIDGYRQIARRMRDRFRGTENALFVIELVRANSLISGSGADTEHLLHLIEHLSPIHSSWLFHYVAGMAHYRAGQHQAAVRRLRQSLAAEPCSARALSYPILAMAHHRLGQAAEARQALAAAATAIDNWTQEMFQHRSDGWVHHLGAAGSTPLPWFDWLECGLFYGEAKRLIDGTPPPPDPRLHVLRARALAGLRLNAQADLEYAKVPKQLAAQPEIRLEVYRNRGYSYVSTGQWSRAAGEFAAAARLRPHEAHLWFFRAVAHLAAGEIHAYRQTCAAALKLFEKTHDLHELCYVIRACVIADGALADSAVTQLNSLSERAVCHGAFGASVRGAALFRSGKYAEAERCFAALAEDSQPRAWHWCYLAMAHHRLGHAGEARRCLDQAARWIEDANREELDDASSIRPGWGSWDERPEYLLLFREATELLKR